MPNIRPVSDLRNYNDVLNEVAFDSPVFLTKNGRGRYVILDITEYDKRRATIELLSELARGEQSAREHGWLTEEEAERIINSM